MLCSYSSKRGKQILSLEEYRTRLRKEWNRLILRCCRLEHSFWFSTSTSTFTVNSAAGLSKACTKDEFAHSRATLGHLGAVAHSALSQQTTQYNVLHVRDDEADCTGIETDVISVVLDTYNELEYRFE
jgi:hypothetical protein